MLLKVVVAVVVTLRVLERVLIGSLHGWVSCTVMYDIIDIEVRAEHV